MGAWGPAIFSDDIAYDIRLRYKDDLANEREGPEATRSFIEMYAEILKDPDDGPVVWLALAATQWRYGRLEDEVKAKALEVIDTGLGLGIWEEQGPKLLAKRKEVLQKLREQLTSPQPPPKKIRKPYAPQVYIDIEPGDAISYQMQSGDYVIFRCVEKTVELSQQFPLFDMLDWIGADLPSLSEIRQMPYAKCLRDQGPNTFHIFYYSKREFPHDRVQIVARDLHFYQPDTKPKSYWSMRWLTVEEEIKERFGLVP